MYGMNATHELTERETEILKKIGAGLSVRTISIQLQISMKTVRSHMQRAQDKLDLEDLATLRAYAKSLAGGGH